MESRFESGSPQSSLPSAMIEIGQIVGEFGLRGHVKVKSSTDFAIRFKVGSRVRVGEVWTEIVECRWHNGRPVLLLGIASTITEAEGLKWAYISAEDTPPELEADEYRTADLLGLEVFTPEGERLGVVDNVERYPAQDVLVVGEILIPAVKAFVTSIDLEARKIIVRLIPGMRPDEAPEQA